MPFTEAKVRSGLVTPSFSDFTRQHFPILENPTIDGVVRLLQAAINVGSPPSIAETTEFVVPRLYQLP